MLAESAIHSPATCQKQHYSSDNVQFDRHLDRLPMPMFFHTVSGASRCVAAPQYSAMRMENSGVKAATAVPLRAVPCRNATRRIRCERTFSIQKHNRYSRCIQNTD